MGVQLNFTVTDRCISIFNFNQIYFIKNKNKKVEFFNQTL